MSSRTPENDAPLCWGSEVDSAEIRAAMSAIVDDFDPNTLMRVLRLNGRFMGFEVASFPDEVLERGIRVVEVHDGALRR
jgi:hypothetical protein